MPYSKVIYANETEIELKEIVKWKRKFLLEDALNHNEIYVIGILRF